MPLSAEPPARRTAELVVVNGLEQFGTKFPLCASEPVFIPALVSIFREFQMCSVFVVSGPKRDLPEIVGALSDLVLEFRPIDERSPSDRPLIEAATKGINRTELVQSCFIESARVPAGQVGGRWGVLGRNPTGKMSFYVP